MITLFIAESSLASAACGRVGESRTVYGATEICRPVSGRLQWVKQTSATTTTVNKTTIKPTNPPTRKVNKTTTTTTTPRGVHGKKLGLTPLWTGGVNKQYGINFFAYKGVSGLDGIAITFFFPPASLYGCENGGPTVYRFNYYKASTFGEILFYGRQEIPVSNNTDGLCSIRVLSLHALFYGSDWRAAGGQMTSTPPPPFYVKFKLENLRNSEVFESPFVLVDLNAID